MLKISLTCVQSSDDVTLLGVTIDKSLTFKTYSKFMHYKISHCRKAKVLANTFIDCQFNYAPLKWNFCRKTFHSKIEKIHHRTLKVISGMVDSYNQFMMQQFCLNSSKHLRFLVTEIFKSISQINPEFMWSFL